VLIPRRVRRAVWRLTRWPPIGGVSVGDLGRLEPASQDDGAARGTPIDRYYIERFLSANAGAVRGRVLELGGGGYAARFGDDSVERWETVEPEPGAGESISSVLTGAYDCILAPQVLHRAFDVAATVRALHRALAPGGVLLATAPGIARHPVGAPDEEAAYWSLTILSARRVFTEVFGADAARVDAAGNVLAAAALLHGLAAEDLSASRLELRHRDFEVVVTVRATRREAAG
jgi:SAM-dependent methyltransferase